MRRRGLFCRRSVARAVGMGFAKLSLMHAGIPVLQPLLFRAVRTE